MVSSHGRFVWYELMTTDMETAKAFYANVVGWGTRDASTSGLAYSLFTAEDSPVAGLMNVPEGARRTGVTPQWMGYVGVDDVDAAVDRIKQLGGAVHVPPTDLPNISRFSVVADPQMATLALVKGQNSGRAQSAELDAPGRVGWHELLATDWETGVRFLRRAIWLAKSRQPYRRDGHVSGVLRRREDDRRHAHQACDIAASLLALLFQHRRRPSGGEARGSWRGPNPVWPDCSAGRRLDRPLHRPSGRHIRAA